MSIHWCFCLVSIFNQLASFCREKVFMKKVVFQIREKGLVMSDTLTKVQV